MEYKEGMTIRDYYEANKKWLQRIAQSSDIVLKSMALAIISVATEPDQ